jgi:RNA polymerase sigma-70 factor (ECF subfamily)
MGHHVTGVNMTDFSTESPGRAVADNDLDLVHATQNGDMSAFEQLVGRYDRKLFRIAEHITRNREDSQDVVQESFLKAFQHLGEFREQSQFSTWLFRITVNQALMKLRKRCTTKDMPLDEDFQAAEDMLPRQFADWAPNPEELYRVSELQAILIKTLEELQPILRTVFVLRDIEELSVDQTAEVLAISRAAVKARLWRARLQLRELLSVHFSKHKEYRDQPRSGQRTGRADGLSLSHKISGLGHVRSQLVTQQLLCGQ